MKRELVEDLTSQKTLLGEMNAILKKQSHDLLINKNKLQHDISEKNMMIEKQYEELQKYIIRRNEFVELLSNEVRNTSLHIVNSVKKIIPKLTKTSDIDSVIHLEEVFFKAKSLLKMLNDISEAHKIEEKNLVLVTGKCNLPNLINSIIDEFKRKEEFVGRSVITTFKENAVCECDEKKIGEVLRQLIDNAIDFTQKGQGGKLEVILGRNSLHVEIIIKDNGIGIEKRNLDKIFDKFYQLDITVLREHGGAGLGLYICKGIIEAHEGKIWAESYGLGMGTEIHIVLPLENKHTKELRKI